MKKHFVVIDGNYDLMRSSLMGTDMITSEGIYTGGIHIFLNMLYNSAKLGTLIVAFDGGHSQYRKNLFSGYKERDISIELNPELLKSIKNEFGVKSKEYQNAFSSYQIQETKRAAFYWVPQILESLGITVIRKEGEEADDLIAYIAQKLDNKGDEVTIFSDDRDYLQLINDNIQIFRPREQKLYDYETFVIEYGFPPNRHILYKAFCGDGSDGIDGVKGIGDKKAKNIIRELEFDDSILPSDIKDTNELMIVLEDYASTKSEFIKKTLLDHREIIDRNIKLMNLHMLNHLPIEVVDSLDEFLLTTPTLKSPDKSKADVNYLMQVFSSLELKTSGAKWIPLVTR